ncbi:MAG: DMT family transporter [Dysgonamonadaceae bacterium]|nr:DMT family transporter [Dysgonamonadaceae bacterium]MDD3355600.1 DMT family transporter [Dysgonamonadaceae bacterium]MDD4245654.1 DMT family transporter [Dysgonamonadaceae bacterium]HUI33111.1 DMT family transporter [Dysgonamonadaceae bacterium]
MISKKGKGHLAMMGANIAWGLMAPLSKSIMMFGAIGYLSLVSFRLGGTAIAFWVASFFVNREKVPPRDLFLIFVASLFAIVFNQAIFITGVSMTSPINASIVTTFLPIITMVIAAFYLKEPITLKKLLGVIVGGAGAILIIVSSTKLDSADSTSNRNLIGILLIFLSQTSYAIYFVFFKNFVEKYSPVTLMKWMFLFASIVYLPFGQSEFLYIDYSVIPFSVYRDIAFVVLGSTFFTYLMVPIGQKNLRPTVASMYNNVQPIVATIAASIIGVDAFGLLKGIAIALVFIGVFIVNRSKEKGA